MTKTMFERGTRRLRQLSRVAVVAVAVACSQAQAQSDALSGASALSAMPVAVSVAAPSVMLSAGVVLTVLAVETAAEGTVWVLQRVSDGARVVIKVAGKVAGAASVATGAAVTVSAVGAGVVLSAAGQVLAFVPNALGRALLHNERVLD